mmetsp:Transcript_5440/g.9179  ORF Transcript_5440/g.9179 Transcript_5440/m.9179 type:complete len:148 (+) Transcript_5440:996-1439(+)
MIFLGEMQEKNKSGAKFINSVTKQIIQPSFLMHVKYFFLNQERSLGVVIIICFVMCLMLIGFLGYHLGLVRMNQTTNESFKHDECFELLKREMKIIEQLILECQTWQPPGPDADQQLMPPIKVDNVPMPLKKESRLRKFQEFKQSCQ